MSDDLKASVEKTLAGTDTTGAFRSFTDQDRAVYPEAQNFPNSDAPILAEWQRPLHSLALTVDANRTKVSAHYASGEVFAYLKPSEYQSDDEAQDDLEDLRAKLAALGEPTSAEEAKEAIRKVMEAEGFEAA